MSQVQQPLEMLPLFAPERAPEPVKVVHDAAELEHARFFDRVRTLLRGIYGGTGIEVTADDARRVMDNYGIAIPTGASPNIMGTLFSGWPKAKSIGRMVRSKRDGSNGNLIMIWTIEK